MKRIIYFLAIALSITLAGCFDTTEETTINKDGTGVFTNTIDLSSMMALLKQMGGGETDKLKSTDTTISFAGTADSIASLSPEQKKIVNQGTMRLTLNMEDEKLMIKLNFPFQKVSDVPMLKQALPALTETAMKKMPGAGEMPMGGGDDDGTPKLKTFDDFFDATVTENSMSKSINKTKYATAADDQMMQSLKQMTSMGSPVTINYIMNLPRPAKKAEGKAVKLSEDKKKVTVSVTSDDFFDDPSRFEYQIEY